MKYFLTTDTHFNHEKVKAYCSRPDDYEKKIFNSLKSIPAEYTLIHLGDVCIGRDGGVHEDFIAPLKCKKILVRGNHDRQSNTWYYNHGWDFVCHTFSIFQFKKRILFSHMPQKDTGYFDLNIHGHFHNTDHRSGDIHLSSLVTDKHKLLALEHTNYKHVSLEHAVNTIEYEIR